MTPQDPVVGSTVLRRPAIQSPNYQAGVSGWTVNADGSAEFNNLQIRGTFNGTDYVINADGAFFYSGTPAAGNLTASIAGASGADGFGNQYLAGHATYGAAFAAALAAGFMSMYTGSVAAGWTEAATVQTDSLGDLVLATLSTIQLAGDVTIGGSLTLGSPLPVSGSSSAAGLPDGTIHGTSGGASAGTGHTHGPGSFAVGNGSHSHGAGSYEAT